MTSGGGPARRYPARVVDAVAQAHYARRTTSPDSARARAQSAFGIASAVVGGLLGGALIAGISELPPVSRWLGVLALVAWLSATALYVVAVAVPVPKMKGAEAVGGDAFVDSVSAEVTAERAMVDARQFRANLAALIAMVLTAVTIALGLGLPREEPGFEGVVHLDDPVRLSCGVTVRSVSGWVYEGSLTADLVRVRPDRSLCDEPPESVYLATASITRIERE